MRAERRACGLVLAGQKWRVDGGGHGHGHERTGKES
jgi:hypothetical protein